tara:strand:+ start:237 stop:470 length:234 start_codon:yes stop_codon:yes gene_type:complete
MALTAEEEAALRDLSKIQEHANKVPALVLRREDGLGHYAFLMDDLERRQPKANNEDPQPRRENENHNGSPARTFAGH